MKRERVERKCNMAEWYRYILVPLYRKGVKTEDLHTEETDKIDLKAWKDGEAWVYEKKERGDGYALTGSVRFGKLEVANV